MFDSIDSEYLERLEAHKIKLHIDEKLPGKTWLFDSSASDKLHHSSACHQQWSERLIGILNEFTA